MVCKNKIEISWFLQKVREFGTSNKFLPLLRGGIPVTKWQEFEERDSEPTWEHQQLILWDAISAEQKLGRDRKLYSKRRYMKFGRGSREWTCDLTLWELAQRRFWLHTSRLFTEHCAASDIFPNVPTRMTVQTTRRRKTCRRFWGLSRTAVNPSRTGDDGLEEFKMPRSCRGTDEYPAWLPPPFPPRPLPARIGIVVLLTTTRTTPAMKKATRAERTGRSKTTISSDQWWINPLLTKRRVLFPRDRKPCGY